MTEKKTKTRKLRVGIWGLGRAGWGMHCPELDSFPEKFEIAAGCDIEASRLKRFSERYPGARTYTDGEAFLSDPEIDLVSVAVRSPEHTPYAIRALQAGKYVFLEKPIALSLRALNRLLTADRQYPGKLYCRHNRRFEGCFHHILELIDSGKFGEIIQIKMTRNSFGYRDDWQSILDCGGGQLNNWGPHLVDQALRFLQSPLKSVKGYLRKTICRGDAEDHVKMLFEGENGRIVDAEISGCAALPCPYYTVYGTRGSIVADSMLELRLKYLNPKQVVPEETAHRESPPMDGSFGGSFQPEWMEETIPMNTANGWNESRIYSFVYDSIVNGEKFPVTLEEAAQVVRATLAIKKQNPAFRGITDNFKTTRSRKH